MPKLISLLLAASFSFLLFVGMTLLIKPSELEAKTANETPSIVITYVEKDDKINPIIRKLPDEPKEQKPPQVIRTRIDKKLIKNKVARADFKLPKINTKGIGDHLLPYLMGGSTNGAKAPRVRINPRYPRIAAIEGIEGFVSLIFDITLMGTTENIRVIESSPRGVFEKAAKRALRKWKYSPEIVNNKPIGTKNEKVTLQFRLEQDVI